MRLDIFMTICLIPCIQSAHRSQELRKINLEDIENDNIASEQRSNDKDTLEAQQTQHLRPPGIHSGNNFHIQNSITAAEAHGISGPGGVIYATPTTVQPYDQSHVDEHDDGSSSPAGPATIQYVTAGRPNHLHHRQEDEYSGQKAYTTPAVHESTRTYSAPSRPSLVKPITPTASSYQHIQHHNHPHQPLQQLFYIHPTAGRSQDQESTNLQPLSNDIQYAHHSEDEDIQYAPQSQDVADSSGEQQQSGQHVDEEEQQQVYQHQHQQHPGVTNYLQYVPLISRGPSNSQSFVMMVPIPAGYNRHLTITPSLVTYAHSSPAAITPATPSGIPRRFITPTPLPHPGVQYLNSNDIQSQQEEVSSGQDSHVDIHSEAQDIQYADPNQVYNQHGADRSKQFAYAPQHPEQQDEDEPAERVQQITKLQYLAPQKVIPLNHPQIQPQYIPQFAQPIQYSHQDQGEGPANPGTVSFFGSFERQPKSLLDSYVPSWVILMRQRALGSQQYASGTSYSTIAYSAPQHVAATHYSAAHFKRSAKKP